MRNIPFFTTEFGIASLVLEEIPYRNEAYITVQSTHDPVIFLKECADFCRMAGATKIYATGHACLNRYPLYTAILEMVCKRSALSESDAVLHPVQRDTLGRWRSIYNQKMRNVHYATAMTDASAEKVLSDGDAYFVCKDGKLLGIGKGSEDTISVVISLVPGGGKQIVLALANAMSCDTLRLEVASSNSKAVQLYRQLGFTEGRTISEWYAIE